MVMAQLRGWDLLSIHNMSCEGSPCYPLLPQIRGSGREEVRVFSGFMAR